jgi:WhiB family redox-sensing transcriptional regulator
MGMEPDFFYPDRNNGEVQRSKAVCKGFDGMPPCPVRGACLDYALENDEKHGVWGGTSERERRRLRKERKAS